MDYKKILGAIESTLKKDVKDFTEELQKYKELGLGESFLRGRLNFAESLVTYIEDLKEIYA